MYFINYFQPIFLDSPQNLATHSILRPLDLDGHSVKRPFQFLTLERQFGPGFIQRDEDLTRGPIELIYLRDHSVTRSDDSGGPISWRS